MRNGLGAWQIAGLLAALVLLSAEPALACPSCFGAVGEIDSPMAEGMNNGVLVLLGVIGGVQGGFAAFFVALWRRQRKCQDRKDSFEVIDGGVR